MYVSQTVETLFSIFDSSAVVLRKELDVAYLEALVETGDNLFEGAILQEELSESAIERLNREYSTFNEETYKGEEIQSISISHLKRNERRRTSESRNDA